MSPSGLEKRANVLVVEDEFLIAMELVSILEDAGYGVIGPVATVEGALAALEDDAFELCVLDVNLRGGDSSPVATKLNQQDIPFVLSSAYDQTALARFAAFEGATNIGKPVAAQKLLSALEALLAP